MPLHTTTLALWPFTRQGPIRYYLAMASTPSLPGAKLPSTMNISLMKQFVGNISL